MRNATLTNEYSGGLFRVPALLPGIWFDKCSKHSDPKLVIGGVFDGWPTGFPIFLSNSNPPRDISPDPKGLGVMVHRAMYRKSRSGRNGNFERPSCVHPDLLLLIQFNGAVHDLCVLDPDENVLLSRAGLVTKFLNSSIPDSRPDQHPAFTALVVIPQGAQMMMKAEDGVTVYLQVFDTAKPIGEGVRVVYPKQAGANRNELLEAAVARKLWGESNSGNVVHFSNRKVS